MRVARNRFRRISGVVDQNFLRRDHHVYGVTICRHIKLAIRLQELHQVERRQITRRVVQEHVFAARIAGVDAVRVFRRMPLVDRRVVLHARIAALPRGLRNLVHQVAGFIGLHHLMTFNGAGGKFAIALHRRHELVRHADRVVGVLKEDGAVSVRVGRRSVVTHLNQRPGLGFFFSFALNKVHDVRMIHVQNDHLGRATRLAAGLDHAGKGVKAFHKAERAAGRSAAGKLFRRATQRGKICSRAAAPLEQHAFRLGQRQNRVERIFHRVDKARRALRRFVARGRKLNRSFLDVPMPVLCITERLQPVTANVEPYRRIKRRLLLDKNMHQLVVERVAVFGCGEIALLPAPVADRLSHALNELADARLALRRVPSFAY